MVIDECAGDRLLGLDERSDDSIHFLGEENVPLETKPLMDYMTSEDDDASGGAMS